MGKTIWFGEVLYVMGVSALITVPNKALVEQTYQSMVKDIGYSAEKVFVINPKPGETACASLQAVLDRVQKPFDGIIISTIQSMTSC
jgi:superfamily II DNA or RNA helicase